MWILIYSWRDPYIQYCAERRIGDLSRSGLNISLASSDFILVEIVTMLRVRKIAWGWIGLGILGALLLVALLSLKGADVYAGPEGRPFLLAVDGDKIDLNDKQAKILARIKKSPGTIADSAQLSRIDEDAMPTADTPALIQLPNGGSLKLRAQAVKKGKDPADGIRVDWMGDRGTENCMLRISRKSATGLIYTKDKVYAVEPLGNGLQVVVQLDQSKFDHEHPKGFADIEKKPRDKKVGDPKAKIGPVVITVLVAYTPKVDELQADVKALINASVDLANQSYINSKVNLRLELVDTVKVDYTESGTHEKDLERFRTKGDGFMDGIHDLRDNKKADICVLLIDNDQYCGLAAAILADADTAFAVVHHDCAVKNLSFPHEIGHLQGARHNLAVDPTVDPAYPFNHGFLSRRGKWRTIMAYPTAEQPNRIPYWSNPNIQFEGEAMGTSDKENNARVLNETALSLSKFR
jgi:Metallo-peptidase family M12B Reprolysin-like